MRKADYARIASFYDKARSLSAQNVELWLERICEYSRASKGAKVLDLGCGTGRFAIPMGNRLSFCVTGADSSREMLSRAREKDASGLVRWDQQDAEHLSYPDESFEVVFMSHLLHHVDSPLGVVRECWRVLGASGAILIRYGAIEQIRDDVEHRFFPETLIIDEARTPTVGIVESWLSRVGFSEVVSEEIAQQTYETGVGHLNAAKTKSTSVLSMISEEAFEKGVCELEQCVENDPDDPSLLFDRLTLTVGYKRDRTQPGSEPV